MRPTKVRVLINVVINTEAWCADYGIEPSEVERDAQSYIGHAVREHLRELGLLVDVTS